MSTPAAGTARIDFAAAEKAARWLASRWNLGPAESCIVGSLRRLRAEVGDIEFIAPMPGGEGGGHDHLYETLARDIEPPLHRPPSLFDNEPPQLSKDSYRWLGIPVKGFKPQFRYCQLLVRGQSSRQIKVEFYRYDDGPTGNRGWTQLQRTGPLEFGKGLLSHYKALHRMGEEVQASDRGYFLDREGQPIATPSELHVFQLCRCLYVEPQMRSEDSIVAIDWLGATPSDEHTRGRLARGMKALEIGSVLEIERLWKEQTLALSTWKGTP